MGLGWVDKILHSLANPANRATNVPAVIAQALVHGMEAQAPSVGGRAPRSRPIEAVRAYVVHGRIVAVTGGREEHRVSVNL